MEKPGENNKKIRKRPLPLLVKAVAVFLLVYGALNFFYYLAVFIYSFVNPAFLKDLEYSDFKGNWLLFPVVFKILLNIMFFVSGIFIINRKKQGRVIFYFTFFISIFFSYFFLNYFNYIDFGFGLIAMLILVVSRSQNDDNLTDIV